METFLFWSLWCFLSLPEMKSSISCIPYAPYKRICCQILKYKSDHGFITNWAPPECFSFLMVTFHMCRWLFECMLYDMSSLEKWQCNAYWSHFNVRYTMLQLIICAVLQNLRVYFMWVCKCFPTKLHTTWWTFGERDRGERTFGKGTQDKINK